MTIELGELPGVGLDPIVSPDERAHSVQFYDSTEFLIGSIADYVATALEIGHPALVIVRRERFEAIAEAVAERHVDAEGAIVDGRLVLVDALSMLNALIVDDRIDPDRFDEELDTALGRLATGPGGMDPVVVGEMVDLLTRDGNRDAAVALEALWNQSISARSFSVLCIYWLRGFPTNTDAECFHEICAAHQYVLPTERYAALDGPGRLFTVAALQQQALALQSELERRRDVESRLQAALADLAELHDRERAARIEAEDACRARSDFLTIMSHELRTPLNAIAGYAELLELGVHGAMSEMQRDYLERIQRSQQRLLGMIDDVLLYSRVESGSIPYNLEDVPVREALSTASATVMPMIREKAIGYDDSNVPARLVVKSDRENLQRIFTSLLANAAKFTPRGGRVRVDATADRTTVRISVTDTGVGVPAEKLEAIFQPFVQVDSRLTRQYDGAGLGLAISRRFAREMGGDLVAENSEGAGTVFTLTLRRARRKARRTVGAPVITHSGEGDGADRPR